MFEFLKILIRFFEENNIPYMLSGDIAISAYADSGFKRDIDFVVHFKPEHVPLIVSKFADGYYCDEDSVMNAIHHEKMFSIIDFKSNCKANFIVLKNDIQGQVEFGRRKKVDLFGMMIYIVSKQDFKLPKPYTPEHIHKLQLKLWLEKAPGERLYQTIKDTDDMRYALREFKRKIIYLSATSTPLANT